MKTALQVQEGGTHYKSMKIQPIEYIHANNIGFAEGAVIKYVSRAGSRRTALKTSRRPGTFLICLIELETKKDTI